MYLDLYNLTILAVSYSRILTSLLHYNISVAISITSPYPTLFTILRYYNINVDLSITIIVPYLIYYVKILPYNKPFIFILPCLALFCYWYAYLHCTIECNMYVEFVHMPKSTYPMSSSIIL